MKQTITTQTLATLSAVVAAVALPQVFHGIGIVSGLGTNVGAAFLPMHLPIILVGLLAGPFAGALAGAVSPLISFALSGMPLVSLLPFMAVELAAYGAVAGALRNAKLPLLVTVLIAQVAGRLLRALFVVIATVGFGYEGVQLRVIWESIPAGLPGLLLQWTALPLIVFWMRNRRTHA